MKNRSGAALVVTMIFIFISVFAVGGYLFVITKDSNLAKKMNDSIKALYLAEAGIERTISDLEDLGVWPGTGSVLYSNTPLGDGAYSVVVQNQVNNNRIRLRADGNVRDEERIITAYVSRPAAFDWGIFSDEEVKLEDALVNSYNSTEGPYVELTAYENGDIGTNATGTDPYAVSLEDSTIKGDVTIGPGGDVITDINMENSTITGDTNPNDAAVVLPPVPLPIGLPNQGDMHLEDGVSAINSSVEYDSLQLEGASVLTINALTAAIDIYVTGEFKLEDTSVIQIIGGNDVNIYIGGEFEMEDNTIINSNLLDPTILTIYGTPTMEETEMENSAVVYGAIYMPNAEFKMENTSNIYGSLVANKVTLESGAGVHYDEALAGTGPGLGGPLNLEFWQEKEPGELT